MPSDRAAAMTEVLERLQNPLPDLKYIEDLSPGLVTHCQATIHSDVALSSAPEPFRTKWLSRQHQAFCERPRPSSAPAQGAGKIKFGKRAQLSEEERFLEQMVAAVRAEATSASAEAVAITRSGGPRARAVAVNLLQRWIRGIRKIAPRKAVPQIVALLVHGGGPTAEEPELPQGEELRESLQRLVPPPAFAVAWEGSGADWVLFEDIMAILDLEDECDSSWMPKASLEERSSRSGLPGSPALAPWSPLSSGGPTMPRAYQMQTCKLAASDMVSLPGKKKRNVCKNRAGFRVTASCLDGHIAGGAAQRRPSYQGWPAEPPRPQSEGVAARRSQQAAKRLAARQAERSKSEADLSGPSRWQHLIGV